MLFPALNQVCSSEMFSLMFKHVQDGSQHGLARLGCVYTGVLGHKSSAPEQCSGMIGTVDVKACRRNKIKIIIIKKNEQTDDPENILRSHIMLRLFNKILIVPFNPDCIIRDFVI